MWFIGVEVEQETSAPPPKKNPGSALAVSTSVIYYSLVHRFAIRISLPSYVFGVVYKSWSFIDTVSLYI